MNGDKLNDIVVVVRNTASSPAKTSVLAALQKPDKTFPGKRNSLLPSNKKSEF
jgi:hypothetical protein